MEIERKFLIGGWPEGLPLLREAAVEQGYLSVKPAVRIRHAAENGTDEYWLTVKGKGTLAREEIELPLSAGQYETMAAMLSKPLIKKQFRVYRLGEHRLECNLVDEGKPTAFFYAEVEFPTVEAAERFVPPAFLGRDVTEEKGYAMADYWERSDRG